jgi:hypothetical protein
LTISTVVAVARLHDIVAGLFEHDAEQFAALRLIVHH